MSKVTVEFDNNNIEDRMELARFIKSTDMASFIFELTYNLRKDIENDIEQKKIVEIEHVEYIFDRIMKLIDDHDININELLE